MLKNVFAFDTAFAGTSAVVLLAGSGPLSEVLGWDRWIVAALGAGLIAYFPLLFMVHRRKAYHSAMAKVTFAGDVGWVLASIAVIILASDQTETAGKWLIAIAAAIVADIGLVKAFGWRREGASQINAEASYSVA